MIGKFVKIKKKNFYSWYTFRVHLKNDLETVDEITQNYPVECWWENCRFTFWSVDDAKNLIRVIDNKLYTFLLKTLTKRYCERYSNGIH